MKKSGVAALSVLMVVLYLAMIGAYLFSYFSLQDLPNPTTIIGPTGPQGNQGLPGETVQVGATGPKGYQGFGSQVYSLTLPFATYWNYHNQAHIFAAELPSTWQPSLVPLTLTAEINGSTYYSYQNWGNDVSIRSVKSLTPSTSSQVLSGQQRTSNYSGFDYIIIYTTPGQLYLPDAGVEGTTELKLETYYLLIRVNILEYDYFNSDYNGVILDETTTYELNPASQLVLTYFMA
jgi:hypothetical protein